MDIKDYVKILKNNWWILALCLIVFVGFTYFFTYKKDITYESSATIEVVRSQQKDAASTQYYQYDNYYTALAATSLSDNMLGWLSSPSTVADVFKKAGYPLPSADTKTLSKIFVAKKKLATSAVVDITYTSTDQEKGKKLVQQALNVLEDKIKQYNQVDSTANFNSISQDPVVVEVPKTYTINLLIAAFASIFVGLSIIFLKEALRK